MAINTQQSIYNELADFLASQPTLEAIAAYKVSSGTQQHIDRLLERNRDGGLSADERMELEKLLAISHLMTLTKTKAELRLAGKI